MTTPILKTEQQKALDDALRMAISAKDTEMMGLALDNGASAHALLFAGIEKYEKEWVELALAKGADANAKKTGWLGPGAVTADHAAIFYMCENFNPDVGDALVKSGAVIDARAGDGQTPLHWAAARGTRQSIEWFINNGADPIAPSDSGRTPMQALSNNIKLDATERTAVTKMMLKAMSAKKTPATPAGDFNQVSTKDAIEVGKPIELKKKPHDGGGLNL